MTVQRKRSLSRLIGALPLLLVYVLTSAAVEAFEPRQLNIGAPTSARKILFAHEPAILIRIDGDPIYSPVPGTDLQRITNTKPFIVRDGAGIHYLKVLDGWMEAYGLMGMWSVAGVPPPGADEALRRATANNNIDLLERVAPTLTGESPSLDAGAAPAIFISTAPAELIVIDGMPRFATVQGSSLEYIENTTATVFREPTDDELYILISGRWFRAWTTDGPWEPVSASDLPSDILAVPGDSPVWHGHRFIFW